MLLLLAFFDQFSFYVGLTDLKMIFPDFWTLVDIGQKTAGVTFSDFDSAPVPKFLIPAPKMFQIWESDSCLNTGNHRCNRNSAMLLIKQRYLYKDHADSCYFRKKLLRLRIGSEKKRKILLESTPALQTRGYL